MSTFYGHIQGLSTISCEFSYVYSSQVISILFKLVSFISHPQTWVEKSNFALGKTEADQKYSVNGFLSETLVPSSLVNTRATDPVFPHPYPHSGNPEFSFLPLFLMRSGSHASQASAGTKRHMSWRIWPSHLPVTEMAYNNSVIPCYKPSALS